MRVVVTGAGGFVGRHLCSALVEGGHEPVAAVRTLDSADRLAPTVRAVATGDLTERPDWGPALRDVDAVIHLAARVHMMGDRGIDALPAYRRLNVDATLELADAAERAGVRRIVYVSSVKAAGEQSTRPLRESDPPAPVDAYGISKCEAEDRLFDRRGTLEVVVVRPPLVYGPGVGGNFRRLLRLVELSTRVPLPFGAASNRRSMVAVENLCDALIAASTHARAPGHRFFVRDGEDLSTPELIRRLGRALGVRARLIPVPTAVLTAAFAILGRRPEIERILGTLQVDDAAIRAALGWQPPVTVDRAFARVAEWYRGANAPARAA